MAVSIAIVIVQDDADKDSCYVAISWMAAILVVLVVMASLRFSKKLG
jgi:hypothetical protein